MYCIDRPDDVHHPHHVDEDALHIHELVVEAGALLEWLCSGRLPAEALEGTLHAVRDELCGRADSTTDPDACSAACGMVASIDAALAASPLPRRERGAA